MKDPIDPAVIRSSAGVLVHAVFRALRLLLLVDKPVHGRSFEVKPYNIFLIVFFNAKVDVFNNKYVLFNHLCCVLVPFAVAGLVLT